MLAARDPHGWYRPASTLEMLTAISLIPLLKPDGTTVTSTKAAAQKPDVVGLLAGHPYRICDLFTALLTISANDVAVALAQATGSLTGGMAVSNAEAHHLQADDTVAVDPNGLDASGQHTSAYDLALIARQALQMPAFLKYDQVLHARFAMRKKKTVTLDNQNSLLTTYRGAALTEVDAAKSLLNWGFAVDGKVTPVGTLVSPLLRFAALAHWPQSHREPRRLRCCDLTERHRRYRSSVSVVITTETDEGSWFLRRPVRS